MLQHTFWATGEKCQIFHQNEKKFLQTLEFLVAYKFIEKI